MREILKDRLKTNQRYKYKAIFCRFGQRDGYKGVIKTVLLLLIVDAVNGNLVCDHIWLDCGKQFDKLKLKEGNQIRFFARSKSYEKGYKGVNEYGEEGFTQIEYGLAYPSKVVKLTVKYKIKEKDILKIDETFWELTNLTLENIRS